MQVCFSHTLFLEYVTETRGNKRKEVFYRYKRIGMQNLQLFWPFSILAKNLGDVLALSLSISFEPYYLIMPNCLLTSLSFSFLTLLLKGKQNIVISVGNLFSSFFFHVDVVEQIST